jgi:hypothetical protein
VTCDVWRVTCDLWRVTCDVQHGARAKLSTSDNEYAAAIKLSADAAIAPTAAKGDGALQPLHVGMILLLLLLLLLLADSAAAAFYEGFLVEVARAEAQKRPRSVGAVLMVVLLMMLIMLLLMAVTSCDCGGDSRPLPQSYDLPSIGVVASTVPRASPAAAATDRPATPASASGHRRLGGSASRRPSTGTLFH